MRQPRLSLPLPRRAVVVLSVLSASAFIASAQKLEAVRVIARPLDRTIALPGEFTPYLHVGIHAKVAGFVEKVEVDRGSLVKEGQLLATIVAPELNAQRAEAQAKLELLKRSAPKPKRAPPPRKARMSA